MEEQEERVIKLEVEVGNMREDIKELKKNQKEQDKYSTELQMNINNLVNSMQVTNEKLDKLCESFETKEKEDNKDSKEVTKLIRNTIITGVTGTIIGAILALIL